MFGIERLGYSAAISTYGGTNEEGGWDEDELSRFGGATGLGPNVLRAETAAVAAGAILCALRGGIVEALA